MQAVSLRSTIWRYLPAFLIVALVPCYVMSIQVKGTGFMHDDGVYLVTAKSLAEGDGYKIISLPVETPQTKYPILFPALLSLVWRVFPDFPGNLPFLKLVPAGAFIGWLFLTFRFSRRLAGLSFTASLWIVLLIAATQWVQYVATTLMSDTLFALLVLASLYLLVLIVEERETGNGRILLLSALIVGSLQTRTAGLPLVVGATGVLLYLKRYRQATVLAAICATALFAWSLWQHQSHPASTSVEAYYTAQSYRDSSLLTAGLGPNQNAVVALINIGYLLLNPYLTFFSAIPVSLPWLVLALSGVIFWALVVRGMKRTPVLLPTYPFLAIYLCMLITWIAEPSRLLIPVLPLILILFYRGLPIRFPKYLAPALVIPVVVGTYFQAATSHSRQTPCFAKYPWAKNALNFEDVDWSALSLVYSWIRQNTSPDSVILTNYDPALYLFTGRHSIRPYLVDANGIFYLKNRTAATKQEEFEKVIENSRARYFVETGHDAGEEPDYYQLRSQLEKEGRLSLVEEFGERYRIYRITGMETAPSFE